MSVNAYFLIRVVVALGFTMLLIIYYRKLYLKSFYDERHLLLSPLHYFYFLSGQPIRYNYALVHIIAWNMSAIFLSIAFMKAEFIISAYIFFAFHPIWTFFYKQRSNGRKRSDVIVYACIFMMLVGVCIFLVGKEGFAVEAFTHDLAAFGFSLIAGIAFALTNISGGEAQYQELASDASLSRKEVYRNYLQLIKYTSGLITFYFVSLYVFFDTHFGSYFYIHIAGDRIPKLQHMADIYGMSSWHLFWVVIVFAVFASLIASIANYWLFLAFCDLERVASVAALELLSIPLGAVFAYLHGFYVPPVNENLFYTGFSIQLIFSALVVYIIEGGGKFVIRPNKGIKRKVN